MTATDTADVVTTELFAGNQLTLGELIQQLGADILDVIVAPKGLGGTIAYPVLHDPTEKLVADTADVVLAVGMTSDGPGLDALLGRAGELGAAAVIAKLGDDVDPRTIDAAQTAGTALLSVTADMSWGQLHTLLRSSLLRAGASTDPVPGGVSAGDLFALANAMSAMIGGAVTIEDPQSRVLAYSSYETALDGPRRETILGRRVPRYWIDRLNEGGVFRRLWTTDEVVLVDDLEPPPGEPPMRRRLAIAVRAGDEILGSIWVAEGDRPFTEETSSALRQAAQLAGLHMVQHRAGADLERKMRADLLRSLFEGRGSLNIIADRLGVDANDRFCVVAFELLGHADAEVALQRERTLQLVALHCEAFRRRYAQTTIGCVVYALLPLGNEESDDGVRRLVHSILARSEEVLAVELRVGIGSTAEHLRAATVSRAHADQVLRILATSNVPTPSVASFEDVRAKALILQLRDIAEEHPEFRQGKIQTLIDHDRAHDSEYVETLRAYLQSFGDVPRAARQISVHSNTFRYRLKRLREIAGIDLDDPDERLATELQLRLL